MKRFILSTALLLSMTLCFAQKVYQGMSSYSADVVCNFRNGKLYRFVTFATIEATGEEAVVYQAMYGDHRYWIRPRANFFEEVEYEGRMVPRFQKVDNAGE